MVKTFTELSDRLIPSQRWRKINGYGKDGKLSCRASQRTKTYTG